MSIFDQPNLMPAADVTPDIGGFHADDESTGATEQADLTYGIFYTSGTTFIGSFGVFVSSVSVTEEG